MMRVAIDARLAATVGGIGRYVFDLVRALGAFGQRHEYTAVINASQDRSWLPKSIRIFPLQMAPKRYLPIVWEHMVVAARLRSGRFDLMHFPHVNVPLGCRGSYVVTAHDFSIYSHPEWFPTGQWLSTALVVPNAVRHARRIIAVSQAVVDSARERFTGIEGKTVVVPNGIDQGQFHPAPHPRRDYLLYVGNAAAYKNIPLLVDVVNEIGQPCIVVGASREQVQLAAGVKAVPDLFSFIPSLAFGDSRLVELLQGARCLLQPSQYESFALPVLEALACGTPVVVADIPSLRSVYGTTIRYASADDPGAWRREVVQAMQPSSEEVKSARRHFLDRHDWRNLVPELERVYSESVT